MPSREWERFIDSFYGDPYMMWHDGIDTSTAARLVGEEREKAMAMLIEEMREGSYWAPMGLYEMKATESIPAMKEVLPQSMNRQRIEIAHALNILEDTTEYVQIIIDVLRNAPFWTARMYAAMRLRDYNLPEVIEALFEAVEEHDYLVRNHSCQSLLYIHGLAESISEYKEIFKEIIVDHEVDGEPNPEAQKHYAKAAEMLKEVIEEKQG